MTTAPTFDAYMEAQDAIEKAAKAGYVPWALWYALEAALFAHRAAMSAEYAGILLDPHAPIIQEMAR